MSNVATYQKQFPGFTVSLGELIPSYTNEGLLSKEESPEGRFEKEAAKTIAEKADYLQSIYVQYAAGKHPYSHFLPFLKKTAPKETETLYESQIAVIDGYSFKVHLTRQFPETIRLKIACDFLFSQFFNGAKFGPTQAELKIEESNVPISKVMEYVDAFVVDRPDASALSRIFAVRKQIEDLAAGRVSMPQGTATKHREAMLVLIASFMNQAPYPDKIYALLPELSQDEREWVSRYMILLTPASQWKTVLKKVDQYAKDHRGLYEYPNDAFPEVHFLHFLDEALSS